MAGGSEGEGGSGGGNGGDGNCDGGDERVRVGDGGDVTVTVQRFADAEQRAEWSRRRARPQEEHPGTGGADGTAEALLVANQRTFQCARCGALVDLVRASSAARADKQRVEFVVGVNLRPGVDFAPGDGCSNPASCNARSRVRDFVKSQAKMAAALRDGKRQLIRQPGATSADSYEQLGRVEARQVGLEILAGLSSGGSELGAAESEPGGG